MQRNGSDRPEQREGREEVRKEACGAGQTPFHSENNGRQELML